MKDELGVKIMAEFVGFRPKTYSYLMDDGNSDKKTKETKIIKSQQIFKSESHNVYTEEINKVELSRVASYS